MPPKLSCLKIGPLSSEVTEAFCRVPSTSFSQAPCFTQIIHLCRFRVRSMMRLFPGTSSRQVQSIKNLQFTRSVTLIWSRNINLVPIDYGFRPRLRGRLTLRGLTLRRKPWIFGDRVFHSVNRYLCQHSHFWYLQCPSRVHLCRLTERSATAYKVRRHCTPTDSVHDLSPVTSLAQKLY